MSDDALTISDLRIGQQLQGVVAGRTVTIVGVDRLSDDLAELYYRDDAGHRGERMITEQDVAAFREASPVGAAPSFDSDPGEFRLAAEALRIRHAAAYDPMVAVNSSDVDPYPHQIRAVYEELLPRIPLRFLLADDPGAGKTIMAGLYLKELILRDDCERAIIVAPGGLVEQWREELSQKFGLRFEVFHRQMVDEAQGRNVFAEHPYLIVRMDQVSRSEDLLEQLADVEWDVAIVDEAHRMSAHFSSWQGEVKETKRFALGRLLSETAHNLLLMTATPHAGKEEDFQLFMSLLDADRFEGQYREGKHHTDTYGLMRRMVKEDLLTFEGKPLFPERRAETVQYSLSDGERDLYERVTDYVRTEMGRAERISQDGDRKRGNNVGFALTVLQRRLASSPAAILQSLMRRQKRLDGRLLEMKRIRDAGELETAYLPIAGGRAPEFSPEDADYWDEEVTDEERWQVEQDMEEVIDLATAARTIPELEAEIAILEDLIRVAYRVRTSEQDRKWVELRTILEDQLLSHGDTGRPRKIIIFTEHKDTLDYLQQRITNHLGRADAVITIHGGTRREDRKAARERFTHDPGTVVLLATDAAGEGMNLQRAHLMVNYDLPWNPNRIEQRFGRIHRIGQKEVCHLWNMVAIDTREGDVFTRLLDKIAQMGIAYNGNLFNVLGDSDAFENRSLRDLLVSAIRYGDRPDVKAKLEEVIDAGVNRGLTELMQERALHPEMFSALDLDAIRQRMELARERRLQPGYIAAFFIPAFERLGGRIRRRERGRFEITRVPQRVIDLARKRDRWNPVAAKYERATFTISDIQPEGMSEAFLIAPGSPLLDAVVDATIADLQHTLEAGTVLVDRRDRQILQPTKMFLVEQRIQTMGTPSHTVSRHFDYALMEQGQETVVTPVPPYLDFDHPEETERASITELIGDEWIQRDHSREVRARVYREGVTDRLAESQDRLRAEAERTASQVRARLMAEINHWDNEYYQLDLQERSGKPGRMKAETALRRSRELEARMDRRLEEIEASTQISATPSVIRSMALVFPGRMLEADHGTESHDSFARNTEEVERRAVEAVLAAERALGRQPEEMARNNPGYDIRSTDREGSVFYLEVKGRIEGADTFTITANEVTFSQTQGERHQLALVVVSPEGPGYDRVRYVLDAFTHIEPSATTRSYNEVFADYWDRGDSPR